MSAPVDVLAVLRADRGEGYADYQERQAAIAAVAALIEAAENALAKVHSYNPARPDATACMVRLRDALARCKGGAA